MQLVGGGCYLAGSLLRELVYHQVLVVLGYHLGSQHVDGGHGDVGYYLVHQRILVLYARHRLVGQVVAHAEVVEVGVGRLVAVGVELLQAAQVVSFGAGVLGLGEAELACALHFSHGHGQGLDVLALLGHYLQLEGIFRLADAHELTIAYACGYKGAIRLLHQLLQAHVNHHASHLSAILQYQIVQGALGGVGHRVVLHVHADDAILLLLVLVGHVDRLLVVGHGLGRHLGGIGIHLHTVPQLLDFCLDVVYVHVAYYDDGLVVGTIPFVIVVS